MVDIKTKEMSQLIEKYPEKCLKIITEIYDKLMLCIAIYNCFWRYIGNEQSKGKLTINDVEKIGKDRDYIAKLYPHIEKVIIQCVNLIGKNNNFDGDLLRYFTLDEMNNFLENNNINKKQINELKKRRSGYFYIYREKPFLEEIITDKSTIERIKENFFNNNDKIENLRGYSAYGGVVNGIIYNLKNHNKIENNNIKEGYIIVTTMTKPEDIDIIKKSIGVITDEGGILSHAVINARELKKPCIIGTKFGSRILNDGDKVSMDADKGIVRILEKAK